MGDDVELGNSFGKRKGLELVCICTRKVYALQDLTSTHYRTDLTREVYAMRIL